MVLELYEDSINYFVHDQDQAQSLHPIITLNPKR